MSPSPSAACRSGRRASPRPTTPTIRPKTTHSTAAPITSDNVTGTVSSTAGTTFQPRLTKEVRSRVMNSFFIITRILDGQRLIEAEILRTGFEISGEALRPAMRAAGSAPGVAKKIRNTSTLMPNITNAIWPRRRRGRAASGSRA